MSRLGSFWEEAANSPLVVLTDFDFTITQLDVGDLVPGLLAPASEETHRRFTAGEIGTRLLWLDSMVRVEPAVGARLADQVGIDPAFPAFAAWCRQEAIPLAVVSDGFGFYIERILRREGLQDLPVFCNEMERKGELLFPYANPACDFCGCCKANVARHAAALGTRIAYVGDGVSDLFAARHADWVFAKASLAQFMQESGSPYYPMRSFCDVRQTLAGELEQFRRGLAGVRSTLGPDSRCRFE